MSKKKQDKSDEEKFTLIELVQSSDAPFPSLIMDLHRAGLLVQYREELEMIGKFDITPSLTKTEFDKIIGD